jgi:hypothetical protein
MRIADALIQEIITSSRIPSAKRRREVARELLSHIEDCVAIQRDAGKTGDEIERMVLARFGDPLQMGRNFSWVYRREQAICRLAVFALSIVALGGIVPIFILALQAGVTIGFGAPISKVFDPRHTMIETADILATVLAYVGIITLEGLFDHHRFPKAMAPLSLIFAVLAAGCRAMGVPGAPLLIFGFANAMILRTIQIVVKNEAARLAVVSGFCTLLAIWFWSRSAGLHYALLTSLASWLVMGLGYQVMADLAVRVNRGLFKRLQEL